MEYRHPNLFRCRGCGFECKSLVNDNGDRFTPSQCLFPPNDCGDFTKPVWVKIDVKYEQTPERNTDDQFGNFKEVQ